MFSGAMATFDEMKLRFALEDLHDLLLLDAVLPEEFIEDLIEPDEGGNSHARRFSPMFSRDGTRAQR